MTPERLAEIRARHAAAVDGPWSVVSERGGVGVETIVDANGMWICDVEDDPASATFIGGAHGDVAELLAEVDKPIDLLLFCPRCNDVPTNGVAAIETKGKAGGSPRPGLTTEEPPLDTTIIDNARRAFDGEVERAIRDLVGFGHPAAELRVVDISIEGNQFRHVRIDRLCGGSYRPVYYLVGTTHGGGSPRFDINGGMVPG